MLKTTTPKDASPIRQRKPANRIFGAFVEMNTLTYMKAKIGAFSMHIKKGKNHQVVGRFVKYPYASQKPQPAMQAGMTIQYACSHLGDLI